MMKGAPTSSATMTKNEPQFAKDLRKEAYREQAEAQLQRWRARLLDIEARGKWLAADGVSAFEEYRDRLRRQVVQAEEGLGSLKAVGEDAWDDAKAKMESLWGALENLWDDGKRFHKP